MVLIEEEKLEEMVRKAVKEGMVSILGTTKRSTHIKST